MNRRAFLNQTRCVVALAAGVPSVAISAELPSPSAAKLPQWRGFNLLEKFVARREGNPPFRESDFEWMAARLGQRVA